MPTSYKVLGQLLPASTSGTLYTVPAATDTVVSTINVVNTGSTTSDISIAIRPAGATIETKNYVVRSLPLAAKAVFTYTAGITLDATDVITVESTTNDVAFNAFGSEITA
jgi:hypothetical protein